MSSATLLETVATHETDLRTQIDAAKAEARTEIESAHLAASTLVSDEYARLEADVAARRREAAAARKATQESIKDKTETRVSEIRAQATGRVDSVRDALVAAVLPQREGA